jgi:hypothetical protein
MHLGRIQLRPIILASAVPDVIAMEEGQEKPAKNMKFLAFLPKQFRRRVASKSHTTGVKYLHKTELVPPGVHHEISENRA